MVLSVVLFALVSLVAGFATWLLTGSLERAALIGGVCGFAAAWLTNTAYIIGLRTGGENRSEDGKDEDGSSTDRQAK